MNPTPAAARTSTSTLSSFIFTEDEDLGLQSTMFVPGCEEQHRFTLTFLSDDLESLFIQHHYRNHAHIVVLGAVALFCATMFAIFAPQYQAFPFILVTAVPALVFICATIYIINVIHRKRGSTSRYERCKAHEAMLVTILCGIIVPVVGFANDTIGTCREHWEDNPTFRRDCVYHVEPYIFVTLLFSLSFQPRVKFIVPFCLLSLAAYTAIEFSVDVGTPTILSVSRILLTFFFAGGVLFASYIFEMQSRSTLLQMIAFQQRMSEWKERQVAVEEILTSMMPRAQIDTLAEAATQSNKQEEHEDQQSGSGHGVDSGGYQLDSMQGIVVEVAIGGPERHLVQPEHMATIVGKLDEVVTDFDSAQRIGLVGQGYVVVFKAAHSTTASQFIGVVQRLQLPVYHRPMSGCGSCAVTAVLGVGAHFGVMYGAFVSSQYCVMGPAVEHAHWAAQIAASLSSIPRSHSGRGDPGILTAALVTEAASQRITDDISARNTSVADIAQTLPTFVPVDDTLLLRAREHMNTAASSTLRVPTLLQMSSVSQPDNIQQQSLRFANSVLRRGMLNLLQQLTKAGSPLTQTGLASMNSVSDWVNSTITTNSRATKIPQHSDSGRGFTVSPPMTATAGPAKLLEPSAPSQNPLDCQVNHAENSHDTSSNTSCATLNISSYSSKSPAQEQLQGQPTDSKKNHNEQQLNVAEALDPHQHQDDLHFLRNVDLRLEQAPTNQDQNEQRCCACITDSRMLRTTVGEPYIYKDVRREFHEYGLAATELLRKCCLLTLLAFVSVGIFTTGINHDFETVTAIAQPLALVCLLVPFLARFRPPVWHQHTAAACCWLVLGCFWVIHLLKTRPSMAVSSISSLWAVGSFSLWLALSWSPPIVCLAHQAVLCGLYMYNFIEDGPYWAPDTVLSMVGVQFTVLKCHGMVIARIQEEFRAHYKAAKTLQKVETDGRRLQKILEGVMPPWAVEFLMSEMDFGRSLQGTTVYREFPNSTLVLVSGWAEVCSSLPLTFGTDYTSVQDKLSHGIEHAKLGGFLVVNRSALFTLLLLPSNTPDGNTGDEANLDSPTTPYASPCTLKPGQCESLVSLLKLCSTMGLGAVCQQGDVSLSLMRERRLTFGAVGSTVSALHTAASVLWRTATPVPGAHSSHKSPLSPKRSNHSSSGSALFSLAAPSTGGGDQEELGPRHEQSRVWVAEGVFAQLLVAQCDFSSTQNSSPVLNDNVEVHRTGARAAHGRQSKKSVDKDEPDDVFVVRIGDDYSTRFTPFDLAQGEQEEGVSTHPNDSRSESVGGLFTVV